MTKRRTIQAGAWGLKRGAAVALAVAFSATALAADDAAVTTKSDKGEVNWTKKTITVTGSGAFSNSASNAAQARLMAEKAAKMDAQRNLLEAVKGVQVSSGAPAGQIMATSEVRTKVEGVVKNFDVVDKKYFSDGGVDVVISMKLDGALAEALLPEVGKKAKAAAPAAAGQPTALIIDARGLGVTPALAPRLLNEAGVEVFGASFVAKEAVKKHGVCAYAKSVEAAKAEARAGATPTMVKAKKVADGSKTDLVLATADAAALQASGYASEGNVVIVVD